MTNAQTMAGNTSFVVKVYYDEDELNSYNGKPGIIGRTDNIALLIKLMQRAYEDYPDGYIDICYQCEDNDGSIIVLDKWRYAPTTSKEWYDNLACYAHEAKWANPPR